VPRATSRFEIWLGAGEATEIWREKLLALGARGVRIEIHGDDVRITVVHEPNTNIVGLVHEAIGDELGGMDWEVDFRGFDPTP
jgi:hypothetical protein